MFISLFFGHGKVRVSPTNVWSRNEVPSQIEPIVSKYCGFFGQLILCFRSIRKSVVALSTNLPNPEILNCTIPKCKCEISNKVSWYLSMPGKSWTCKKFAVGLLKNVTIHSWRKESSLSIVFKSYGCNFNWFGLIQKSSITFWEMLYDNQREIRNIKWILCSAD